MPRGHHDPLYWVVVQRIEEFIDMRTVHLADGRICEEEELRERAHVALVLLPAAVDSADSQDIGQSISRYGVEVDSVQRKLRRRAQRTSNLIEFPRHDEDPNDGAAALRAA